MTAPRAVCLAALATLVAGCTDDPSEPPKFRADLVAELDALLDDTRTELDVPGICAILDVRFVGRYERCSGTAELGGTEPMTLDMHIRMGSITKTFTVTMLLQLVDRGAVALEDPISKYVPDSPKPDVTLLQLASMTTGIASYTFDPGFQDTLFTETDKAWEPGEVLAIGAANTEAGCPHFPPACFEPGEGWAYSNTNIVLLGLVVEAVTGKSYAENLQELITNPLGLANTFRPADGTLPEPFAHGYTFQGAENGERREATSWNPTWGFGTGDLVSTTRDLARYAEALGSGVLLAPDTARLRETKVTLPPNQPDHAYAVGVGFFSGWWGHQGSLPGYNSYVLYRPDAQAALAVVVNNDGVDVDGTTVKPAEAIANRIIDIGAREAPLGDFEDDDTATDDPSL